MTPEVPSPPDRGPIPTASAAESPTGAEGSADDEGLVVDLRSGNAAVVPWGAAAAIFAVYFPLALGRLWGFVAGYDLGYFSQAAYLIRTGRSAFVTVRGLNLLADHAYLGFYPIAWVAACLATAPALLAFQSAALALGAVPLYAIARKLANLSVGVTVALLFSYAVFPALVNINLADYHPESIAVPALLCCVLFGLTRRWIPYAASAAVVLLIREDLALTMMFVGVLLVLERHRRAGLITIVVSGVWLVIATQVLMPHFANGQFVQGALRYPQYGDTLASVGKYMLLHPHVVLRDFLHRANAKVFLELLAPLAFLPVLSPRFLMPGLPLQCLYLLSNVPAAHTIDWQYTVAIIPFLFVATAMALGKQRELVRFRTAAVATLIAFSFGGFLMLANASPSDHPWSWFRHDEVDQAREKAIALIPKGASVSASPSVWPELADRANLYNFPMPFAFYSDDTPGDPIPLAKRQADVDWVVFDRRVVGQFPPGSEEQILNSLPARGFRKIFDRNGIVVLHRE